MFHKWHSNQLELEMEENAQGDTKEKEVQLSGLAWETIKDNLSISLGANSKQATKGEVLRR